MAIRAPDGANNLYLDIDMIASLSIGTWNWIGVYLWSCLLDRALRFIESLVTSHLAQPGIKESRLPVMIHALHPGHSHVPYHHRGPSSPLPPILLPLFLSFSLCSAMSYDDNSLRLRCPASAVSSCSGCAAACKQAKATGPLALTTTLQSSLMTQQNLNWTGNGSDIEPKFLKDGLGLL